MARFAIIVLLYATLQMVTPVIYYPGRGYYPYYPQAYPGQTYPSANPTNINFIMRPDADVSRNSNGQQTSGPSNAGFSQPIESPKLLATLLKIPGIAIERLTDL